MAHVVWSGRVFFFQIEATCSCTLRARPRFVRELRNAQDVVVIGQVARTSGVGGAVDFEGGEERSAAY